MELSKKVKTALEETRMLILGVQVFIGFQFRVVFQDGFDQLTINVRRLHILALLLMLSAAALLIAPALWHRIIAASEITGEVHRMISRMAGAALLPFSLSLGLALFITMERIFGLWHGVIAGTAFGALALFSWYGLEFIRSHYIGQTERQMSARQLNDVEKTPLHNKIEQMLTEARVILPGVQALLGFQLAIIITESFETLPASSKTIHAVSVGLLVLSMILLMAPAAYHRIVYAGEDAAEFHRTGSLMVTAATIPLALGISLDVFVVVAKIENSIPVGSIVGGLACAGFIAVWYAYPALRRGVAARQKVRS